MAKLIKNKLTLFYICGSVHHQSSLLNNQRDADLRSPNLAMTL
jgi:hypothetical protein